jgi:hypothetical protein
MIQLIIIILLLCFTAWQYFYIFMLKKELEKETVVEWKELKGNY